MPTINDFVYVSAHGRLPRGQRSWKFLPGDGAGHVYKNVPSTASPIMTFSDARRWAKKKLSGYPELYVLP